MRLDKDGVPTWYNWNRTQFATFWENTASSAMRAIERDQAVPKRETWLNAEEFADKWFSCIAGAYCPGDPKTQATTEEAQAFARKIGMWDVCEEFPTAVYLRRYQDVERMLRKIKSAAASITEQV